MKNASNAKPYIGYLTDLVASGVLGLLSLLAVLLAPLFLDMRV